VTGTNRAKKINNRQSESPLPKPIELAALTAHHRFSSIAGCFADAGEKEQQKQRIGMAALNLPLPIGSP